MSDDRHKVKSVYHHREAVPWAGGAPVNRARDAEHAARALLSDLRDAESLVESEDDAAELTRIADVLTEAATAARARAWWWRQRELVRLGAGR